MEWVQWLVIIVSWALVLGWAIELIRRLGDHTKVLRTIADDVASIRRSMESGSGTSPTDA